VTSVVNLHYITVLQHSLVANVGRPVCRAMIETRTSGESNTCLKTIRLDQSSVCGLNLVADIHYFHARLNERLGIFSRLSVYLGSTTQVIVLVF
jgi:hypothetical protein